MHRDFDELDFNNQDRLHRPFFIDWLDIRPSVHDIIVTANQSGKVLRPRVYSTVFLRRAENIRLLVQHHQMLTSFCQAK